VSYTLPPETTNITNSNLAVRMDDSELRAQLEIHHRESFGWALSCCRRDPGEAETVLQESYLKILDGRAQFRMQSSFKTWLFAVIRKTAADQWRRRVMQRLRLARYAENAEPARARERFEDSVYHSEIQSLFRRALLSLPKRRCEVMQLVFYHDLSLAEAAEVMGVSIGSVRQHYDRAKKQLRELLANSGVLDETGFGRTEDQAAVPTVEAR